MGSGAGREKKVDTGHSEEEKRPTVGMFPGYSAATLQEPVLVIA